MSSKESLRNRLATLMDRHRALDKQVSDDYKNRIDDSIIQKEKFDKLHLKREIESLQKQLGMLDWQPYELCLVPSQNMILHHQYICHLQSTTDDLLLVYVKTQ